MLQVRAEQDQIANKRLSRSVIPRRKNDTGRRAGKYNKLVGMELRASKLVVELEIHARKGQASSLHSIPVAQSNARNLVLY